MIFNQKSKIKDQKFITLPYHLFPFRGIVFSLILFILFVSPSLAWQTESSKEYVFTADLIKSIHFCQWALDFELGNEDTPTALMTSLLNQNRKLLEAKAQIEKYRNDPSKNIRFIVRGALSGIHLVRMANSADLKCLVNESMENPVIPPGVGKMKAEKDQGWELIGVSAASVSAFLFQAQEKRERMGTKASRIVREESRSLLRLIEESFRMDLNLYERHLEAVKEGLRDPKDKSMSLIEVIDDFRVALLKKNYMEEGNK